jgi:hypothetical protein
MTMTSEPPMWSSHRRVRRHDHDLWATYVSKSSTSESSLLHGDVVKSSQYLPILRRYDRDLWATYVAKSSTSEPSLLHGDVTKSSH